MVKEHKAVNDLPRVVTQPHPDQESNLWPRDRKSNVQAIASHATTEE